MTPPPPAALNADELIAAARAATGLHDFGEPDVSGPLGVLVEALNRESRLTPAGVMGKRMSLLRALSNRLRLNDQVIRHPELLREKVRKPVIIAGLQRTGTTKLHRYLASDPGANTLPLWRMMEPVPAQPTPAGQPDPRYARAEAFVEAMKASSPGAYAAHPMYAMQADEEVFVMEIAFLANINATAFHAPSFEAWLKQQSFEPWYLWFERLLQYIQYADGTGGRHWILKAPHHLGFFPLVFRHFPDAVIVHCHRDPLVAVASFAALAFEARKSTSEHADRIAAGRYCLRYCAERIQTCLDDRDRLGRDAQIVDVCYRDIVSDTAGVAHRVYDAAGLELTPAAATAMAGWEREHEQHKHGRHSYTLADFGIDRDEALALFKPYMDRFADYL